MATTMTTAIEKILDAARAVPAGDVGRDFIGQCQREHRRVARQRFGRLAGRLPGRFNRGRVVEKTGVLRPREIHQHLQAVFGGRECPLEVVQAVHALDDRFGAHGA